MELAPKKKKVTLSNPGKVTTKTHPTGKISLSQKEMAILDNDEYVMALYNDEVGTITLIGAERYEKYLREAYQEV